MPSAKTDQQGLGDMEAVLAGSKLAERAFSLLCAALVGFGPEGAGVGGFGRLEGGSLFGGGVALDRDGVALLDDRFFLGAKGFREARVHGFLMMFHMKESG